MIVKAFSKVNLALKINEKDENGYHKLESVMVPLKLHDVIEIEPITNGWRDDAVISDDFDLANTKINSVQKTLALLRERFHYETRFNVEIHKEIFLQSGLGGGSSDAAAVMRAVIKFLKLEISDEELVKLALKIGSDVPFFLFNKPAIVKSYGEEIETFDFKSNKFTVLLVKPKEGLSTKTVFEEFDKNRVESTVNMEDVKELLIKNDLDGLQETCKNALEPAAFKLLPEIESIVRLLKLKGFEYVHMTGSGSCVFAITRNKKLARKCEKAFEEFGYIVERTAFL